MPAYDTEPPLAGTFPDKYPDMQAAMDNLKASVSTAGAKSLITIVIASDGTEDGFAASSHLGGNMSLLAMAIVKGAAHDKALADFVSCIAKEIAENN